LVWVKGGALNHLGEVVSGGCRAKAKGNKKRAQEKAKSDPENLPLNGDDEIGLLKNARKRGEKKHIPEPGFGTCKNWNKTRVAKKKTVEPQRPTLQRWSTSLLKNKSERGVSKENKASKEGKGKGVARLVSADRKVWYSAENIL